MMFPRIPILALALMAGASASAQQVTPPANPMVGTQTRSTGGGVGGGVSIRRQPAQPVAPKKVTFIVVSPVREWRDVEERRIRASLVAFDEPKRPEAEAGKQPARILVRAGKVRLWVEGSKQVSEFPLSRLCDEDQTYVRRMVEAARRPRQAAPEGGEDDG
jgi:hypothetical protein